MVNLPDKMLHKIYSCALPLSLRAAVGQGRNRIKQWWWEHHPVKTVKWWYIRKRVSTEEAQRKRGERHHRLLESGQVINVVFEVTGIPKWKNDSVLQLMMEHPQFRPLVWHVPYSGEQAAERYLKEQALCNEYFSAMGAKVVRYASLADFPAEEKPDIVFTNEPYDISVYDISHNKGILGFLLCYVPYAFTSAPDKLTWNHIISNGSLFNFVENNISKQQLSLLMDNRGRNIIVSGHPMADSFLTPNAQRKKVWKPCGIGMKRVIWAPHWTIEKETCWLFYGTFMQTGKILLEMAEKYRGQIQFAFKPHPNLYYALCKHPEWGKERTDAFYAKWREMPNTQFEDGAYADLFMQSDAMIHDCGSFIQEYLFADKPCMYLKDPENKQEYSAMAADCLNAYQIGITREEIEDFLQMVLRGEDPKAEVRRELRKKYLVPPHGQSAAQNIIDCLLMQDHHG